VRTRKTSSRACTKASAFASARGDFDLANRDELWRLEGYTNSEIAERLECTLRTVERKVERIRAYWESREASDSA